MRWFYDRYPESWVTRRYPRSNLEWNRTNSLWKTLSHMNSELIYLWKLHNRMFHSFHRFSLLFRLHKRHRQVINSVRWERMHRSAQLKNVRFKLYEKWASFTPRVSSHRQDKIRRWLSLGTRQSSNVNYLKKMFISIRRSLTLTSSVCQLERNEWKALFTVSFYVI